MNVEKIQKLLRLLSSNNDGEIVAAARAIVRVLEAEGTDIHELVARVEGRKPSQAEAQRIYDEAFRRGKDAAAADRGFSDVGGSSFYGMACEIMGRGDGRLSPKEQRFVDDMTRWCAHREPSEKQAKWLHAIYCR